MNNIVVIGGSGYIGSHLKQNFPEYIYTSGKDFDLNNKKEVFDYFGSVQIDVCIILAAKIGYEKDLEISDEPFNTNVNGLNNLLYILSLKNPLTKIIYFSSMTVYSANNISPVDESGFLAPLHGYGLSKVWAESLIHYYNFASLIIRIPGVYGGDRKNGFIYNTIKKMQLNSDINIETEKLGYWETIHIDDLIYFFEKLIRIYRFDSKNVDIYNISYGEATDLIKTAKFIKEQINSSSNINITKEYKDFYLDNGKLSKIVKPKNSYYERLKKYIKEVI